MWNWQVWRAVYDGGQQFRDEYLQQFSDREDTFDFEARRNMTPIPTFAKTAINEVRNSIFQRLVDIMRSGGSQSYRRAVEGLDGGVDRRGATMSSFMGVNVLTELLVVGRTGIYVDNPQVPQGTTLNQVGGVRPYVYNYQVEDILSWTNNRPEDPSEFQAILLRDTALDFDTTTLLPTLTTKRFRRMWLENGKVHNQFYNLDAVPVDQFGVPNGPTVLDLNRIPFAMLDINASLMQDIAYHQIALLNLGSSDVNYAIRANFPFYIEQRSPQMSSHLKRAATDGGAQAGELHDTDENVGLGATQGRTYQKGMNAPSFINPSSEPLKASMDLQAQLKADIRELVNLTVSSLARKSAESKEVDNKGLEAGLSYLGLILQNAENQIAEYWAAYEEKNLSKRQIATIRYPEQYSLKSQEARIKEAGELQAMSKAIPGRLIKRELAKKMVNVLLGGKVTMETIEEIQHEIDTVNYTTSDPEVIIQSAAQGIIGGQVAATALGFDDDEYEKAKSDHAEKIARIQAAQTPANNDTVPVEGTDLQARGVTDLATNQNAGVEEKQESRDTALSRNIGTAVRGRGTEMGPLGGAGMPGLGGISGGGSAGGKF